MNATKWAFLCIGLCGMLLLGIWLGEWCSLEASRPVAVPLRFEEVHVVQRPWRLVEAAPSAAQPTVFGAVYGPNYVRQDFRCPADNLSRIAIWMAGPVGQVAELGLHNWELGVHFVARIEIDRALGGYYNLTFPSLSASKGRLFSLVVAAPGASFERAISLRIAPRDRLGGPAYLNLYPVVGNVDLAAYHSGPPGRWWLDALAERFVPTAFRGRIQQYKPRWAKGATFGVLVVAGFGLSLLVLLSAARQWKKTRLTLLILVLLAGGLLPSVSQMLVRRGPRSVMLPYPDGFAFAGCCSEVARLALGPFSIYDLLMNLDQSSRDLSRERDRDYARPALAALPQGSHPGLALAGGGSMSWNVQIQPGTTFSSALLSRGEPSWFDLWVQTSAARERVLHQLVQSDDGRWEQIDVDLAKYAGQSIKLELACPEGDCLWGTPHLSTDGSWLQLGAVPAQGQERARFGDEIELLAYDLDETDARPGGVVVVDLSWRAVQQVETDYTVFVHLLDENGAYVVGQDGGPVLGTFATTLWDPAHIVLDSHALSLPADLKPGEYVVQVGLYELETMTRLPAYTAGGERIANDALWLEKGVRVGD